MTHVISMIEASYIKCETETVCPEKENYVQNYYISSVKIPILSSPTTSRPPKMTLHDHDVVHE